MCEMASCDRYDGEMLSACGIYYVCPACREAIEALTAIYLGEDAAEAARLAEKAGAANV
jgi:hypothetical protein